MYMDAHANQPVDEVSAVCDGVECGVGDEQDLAELLKHLGPRGPADDAAALPAVADHLVDRHHHLWMIQLACQMA